MFSSSSSITTTVQQQLLLCLSTSPPPLVLFFTWFLTIYLTAHLVTFRSWAPHLRPEAASCAISLFHGTPAAILASYTIFDGDKPISFDSTNTVSQNLVLDYSVAYFLVDLLHYLVFYPRDVLFIGHHLATLFVFMTCRFLVLRGAYAVLVLLILAEVTSLCQNVWTLARARRGDLDVARRVYDSLCVPFYVVYSIVRGLLGPLFVCKMLVFFYWGIENNNNNSNNNVPRWVWMSWVVVVMTAIAVSWLWISNLWIELYRERKNKLDAKLR